MTTVEDKRALEMNRLKYSVKPRRAISILEMLAVVTLLGIIAMVVVPRFSGQSTKAKIDSCHVNKGNIEVQVQLWIRNKGRWREGDLKKLAADTTYFTEGVPTCPVDGSSYSVETVTQRVVGHQH